MLARAADAGALAVSENDRQLLIRAYEAFNAHDIEGALATMHAEVDWPNGMEGGRVRGHRQVREYWKRQFGLLDPCVQIMRIERSSNGCTIAIVRQTVRDLEGNVLSDTVVAHEYAIGDGQIERMDIRDPQV